VILEANLKNIKSAAELIRSGEAVAFPTETVYGLGANALNPSAVVKIFEIKKRPKFNPLIIHIADKSSVFEYSKNHNEKIFELIKNFWPGPLTLVLKKKKNIPDIVTAGNDTVAIRMPNHKTALRLIEYSGCPIAAPSANSFGLLSPTDASHVDKQLGGRVKLILDGGKSSVGVESTIISFADETPTLLRHGGLPIEKIEKLIGKIKVNISSKVKPNSPGQMKYHYAPAIPIYFLNDSNLKKFEGKKIGALFFEKNDYDYKFELEKILSKKGNLNEAALNFFKMLHDLENENIDLILAEKVPLSGIGFAITDRLQRAVNKYS